MTVNINILHRACVFCVQGSSDSGVKKRKSSYNCGRKSLDIGTTRFLYQQHERLRNNSALYKNRYTRKRRKSIKKSLLDF